MFKLNDTAILGSYFDSKPKTSVVASASSVMSGSGGSSGFNAGGTFIQHDLSYHLLDGFINFRSQNTLYRIYREIYTMDAVTGPAIDQISSLPWSSYSLLGVQDKQIMDLYMNCLSELNIIRLLTYMSTTYLVLGTVIGSLVFDKTRGLFSDCILYNPDDCEITPIPMIGYDPKVNVKISKEMIQFLNSSDFRDLEAKKEIPSDLEAQLRSGKVAMLEPLSTIILSRDMIPGVNNLSYLSRILPIWIVEKALTRGTIQASLERQRGVLQIQCLHANTLIYVNNILKPIGNILPNIDIESLSCGTAFDVDFWTKGLDDKWVRVRKWIYQGKKPIYQLVTFNGLKIKCTLNHKFACLDENKALYYKELHLLSERDLLITEKGLTHMSYIKDLEYKDDVYDISIDTSNGDRPVFVANNMMVHNCIVGESLIDKDGKLVRIDSISDSREEGKPVDVDFTTIGFNGKRVRVHKWIYQGKREVYEVKTKSGYSIQATKDHKFVTLKDGELKYTLKELSKLKEGDLLVISDKNEVKKTKPYKFTFNKRSINKNIHYNQKRIKIPEFMTPELAYVLGIILSDGEVSDSVVNIVGNDLKQLKVIKKYISIIFSLDGHITLKVRKGTKVKINNVKTKISKDVYTLQVASKSFIEFLKQIGIKTSSQLNKIIKKKHIKPSKYATYAKPCYAKTIPFSIFEADEESQFAFLAGYIDGDGNVCNRKDKNDFTIRICSYSNDMLHQLQILLSHLGMKSIISWSERSIKISSHNIDSFYEKLKKYILIKDKKINSYRNWTLQGNWSIGLPTASVISELESRFIGIGPHQQYVFRNDDGEEKIIKHWGRITTSNLGRHNGPTKIFKYHQYKIGSYNKLFNKITEISASLGRRVHSFMEEAPLFDTIISIRKIGIKDVYDISIDTSNGDVPVFVANGLNIRNCGSDEFEYTEDQQRALASLVANANRDPMGAVIVTRPDVSISEFRSGSDFWSINNERDVFTNVKLRALGLSESFGADTNYSSGENSITIFLEHMRAFRESFTRSVLYDKVFLLLAKYHGFRKRARVEIDHNIRYDENSNKAPKNERFVKYAEMTGSRNLAEAAVFHIPEVRWTKELQARGDSNALSLLQTAKDLGMPLPIGLISTFAGVPLNNLLDNLKEDLEARKKIKEYQDELKKINPEASGGGDDGGMFGSVKDSSSKVEMNNTSIDKRNINKPLLAKLRHSSLVHPKQMSQIKDKNTLLAYLEENVPPEVKITANQAKNLIKQANAIKPGLIKP